MIRGDDPVTLVNEKHETVPKTLCSSSTARAHSAKSTGRISNTATPGNWSTKWECDSQLVSNLSQILCGQQSHPSSMMTKTGDRRHQVVTSRPVPATEHGEGCRQVSQTAAAKLRRPTATPDRCGANRQQPLTNRQRRHVSEE